MNLCLSLCLFFVIIIPITLSHLDDKYQTCIASSRCGNIQNIGYPFWGLNKPEYCGYPGLRLICDTDSESDPKITSDGYFGFANSFPVIAIMDRYYRVLHINSESKTLTVARQDYWLDVCPIDSVTLNSTSDFTLFDFTSDTQNITLYYGCPEAQGEILATLLPNQFNCSSNETLTNNYYFLWNASTVKGRVSAISTYLESCDKDVIIPVWESTARALEKSLNPITLSEALRSGFGLQWHANDSFCDECVRSEGVCGYDNSTRQFTCYCPHQPYPFTCPPATTDIIAGSSSLNLGRKVVSGVLAGVGGIVVISALFYMRRKKCLSCIIFWNKKTQDDQDVEATLRNYGALAPKRYNYAEVKKMTNSFTDKLGQGGYGVVYKGKLYDGRVVAVKVLSKSKGNGEEFINEVACISSTSHVNIVTLLGFCYERNKRALIYEFMPNGSLDKFIYDKRSLNTNQHLGWRTLNQIVVGVARGLEYLHRGCNARIVHFDIKAHNILLDEDFCPKISDFGLAKLCKKKESIISMLDARGTVGYIAPEVFCRIFGGISHKSDVYGFGMMVLEMVGVRNNIDSGVSQTNSTEIYFPDWIYKRLEPGEDLSLHGIATEVEEEIARKMILVSLWCIQTNPSDRPSMSKVVEMLEGGLESLQVPPKPHLHSSSPRSFPHSSIAIPSLS
ncbi:Receptor-like kinase [Melia azedarach]|uniref:Receptor-like kinase n=1 Tax=Melia azedarach TaxID=155640 RepID=A0ACC1X797_MELAZ|nr:Receptor-like kinase [Melia azedarach]